MATFPGRPELVVTRMSILDFIEAKYDTVDSHPRTQAVDNVSLLRLTR